jgi:peptide/nickel transport system permease protein
MLVFILKRVPNAAGVMLAVAALAFATFRFVGDPVEMMLNEHDSVAQRQELRERLSLDRSLPEQYAAIVINAARGDFGVSYRNQQDVFPLVAERLPATFELVIVATVLSLLIGLPLGSIPASTGGPSLPSFCNRCLLSASRCPVSRWVSC